MQRPSHPALPSAWTGIHVGIIMDGNGRWARARGLPRTAGHSAGVRAARNVVEAATRAGVGTLTLYAFSADNWSRPTTEVQTIMRLFRRSLMSEAKRCLENGVRLSILGRRDRLSPGLVQAIEDAEALTVHGRTMHLRVAIDYSARDAILRAAKLAASMPEMLTRKEFGELLARVDHDGQPAREVDLLVRTGGEQRLSDFLLWECAYAELYFTDVMWPEFRAEKFDEALAWFAERDRRFGTVRAQAAS